MGESREWGRILPSFLTICPRGIFLRWIMVTDIGADFSGCTTLFGRMSFYAEKLVQLQCRSFPFSKRNVPSCECFWISMRSVNRFRRGETDDLPSLVVIAMALAANPKKMTSVQAVSYHSSWDISFHFMFAIKAEEPCSEHIHSLLGPSELLHDDL